MTKKRFFLSLLMCITFNLCMAQQSAEDKAYTEKVVEVVKVSRLFDNLKEAVALGFQEKGLTEAQCSAFADELFAIMTNHADELIVPMFKASFTSQDLDDLITFYQSQVGKKITDPKFMENAAVVMFTGLMKYAGEFEKALEHVKEKK